MSVNDLPENIGDVIGNDVYDMVLEHAPGDESQRAAVSAVAALSLSMLADGVDMALNALEDAANADEFVDIMVDGMVEAMKPCFVRFSLVCDSLDGLGVEPVVPDIEGANIDFDDLPREMQEKIAEELGDSVDGIRSRGLRVSAVAIDSSTGEAVSLDELPVEALDGARSFGVAVPSSRRKRDADDRGPESDPFSANQVVDFFSDLKK